MRNRWLWVLLVSVAGMPGLVGAGLFGGGTEVIRMGEPVPVWVAADAALAEREAAADLARVLGRMVGGPAAAVRELPARGSPAGIHVGRSRVAQAAFPEMRRGATSGIGGRRDRDTVLIASGGGRVVLAGYDAGGTVLAVYRFLQAEGGVIWLYPGVAGELVKPRWDWRVPAMKRREVPGFLSREFYFGGNDPDEQLWLRRNLLRPRAEYQHRAAAYADPQRFDMEPELFAMFPEGPRDPRVGRRGDWQPNYGAPAVAAAIAEAAGAAFAADPERAFFAVSPNDSVRFGDLPGDAFAGWFRRHPNVSAPVFGAINDAARSLQATHPDRYLGMLAYHWYEAVPQFSIEPNVAIYLALDRFQGRRPARAREDAQLTAAWAASGAGFLGLYEYVHGIGQAGPRVWPKRMAEAWAQGHVAGARGLFAEFAPHWGWQGVQPWLAAQLAWQPDLGGREVNAVTEEAWRALAGAGAPYLRAVFERAEQRANLASGEARWLPDFREPDQLELFPESFWRTAQAALAAAQRAEPVVAVQLERLYGGSFRLGAALAAFDSKREALRQGLADGIQGGRLARRLEDYQAARAEVLRLRDELAADPLHARMSAIGYLLAEDPAAAAEVALGAPAAVPVGGFSFGGMESPGGRVVRSDGGVHRPLTAVEGGLGDVPAGWFLEVIPAEGLAFGLRAESAREGDLGFRMEGMEAGLLATWAPAEGGGRYRLTVPVRGRRPPGASAVAFIAWYGADGVPIPGAPVLRDRPARGTAESWRSVELVGIAPEGAQQALVGLSLRHWSPGQGLDVDAVGWERLAPPPAGPGAAPEPARAEPLMLFTPAGPEPPVIEPVP